MRCLVCLVGLLIVAVSAFRPGGIQQKNSLMSEKSNGGGSGSGTSSTALAVAGTVPNPSASTDAPPLARAPPRKVFLIVEPTPFTHVSGYSNRFKEMLKYTSKAGDDVEILTVDAKTEKSNLPKEHNGYNIHHTQGFTFPLYNHISLSCDLPELKGWKLMGQQKPDLIHVTSPGFMLFASVLYSQIFKIPLVMSYHTHLPAYGKNYLSFVPKVESFCWWLLRRVHSAADLTLCTSPQMKQELSENGIPRVDVWRKGIDTERFDPKFRSQELREEMSDGHPNDFLMVYVGRLGAEKRLKDIKPMLEKMPNARLCIVGGGPQEAALKEHFNGTKTVFTGQLSGDKLSSAFASADVFVMPSDSETLGFVVLESMASGVPVVGARAGGIPHIIDDGKTSYLADPGDIDGFVSIMEKLRKDKKLRETMGKNARKEAERWGWEAATSVLRNLQYEKALINFHARQAQEKEELKGFKGFVRFWWSKVAAWWSAGKRQTAALPSS